jgi:succinyl-diaminopimelate desuccinylase
LITGDEETGGFNGAKKVLSEISSEFCIALDGGCVDNIVTKEKGMLNLRLVSLGRAAHGARPWLGVNAIQRLAADIAKVQGLFAESTADHWHKTANLGIIQGGEAPNQVPDRAEAVFNIRYTEYDDIDELIGQIRARVDSEVVVEMREPVFRGGESRYLGILLEEAEGATATFEHGASDARFLSEYGIDGVVWGADGDASAHGPDEHVNIQSVDRLYGVLDRFISRLAAA